MKGRRPIHASLDDGLQSRHIPATLNKVILDAVDWDGPSKRGWKKNTKIHDFPVISPVWGDFPVTFDYRMVINPISEKNGMGSNIEIST
jgi:hypothetical protein